MYDAFSRVQGEQYEAHSRHHALPRAEDMDRILRYEERMHRQLDWAIQRLLESQERRKTSLASYCLTLCRAGGNCKTKPISTLLSGRRKRRAQRAGWEL